MGLFRNFSSNNLSNAAPLFQIRVDNDIIVLRGTANEAASQVLKGRVVLCLRESMKVQDINLKMTGICKVGWTSQRPTATGISNEKVGTVVNIYTHNFGPLTSHQTLLPGNYEWPFEVILPGNLPESILGLRDSYITYTLKAVVERGLLAHNLQTKKLVRIVRTFDPSALELNQTMIVENIWPNKVEYCLVIPQKAVIFGTAIEVKMQFTSLLKGLKIGKIRCNLIEYQSFTTHAVTRGAEKSNSFQRDIDNWTFELSENAYQDVINEGGSDGWVFEEKLPLPKQLSKCMQDVDTNGLKIRHKVKFNIALHNPDGHISELRATLPVTIFISPNMPIDDDGCLVDQTPVSSQAVEIGAGAPPLYGEHVLDQIYGGIDPNGYMTPGVATGMNTPFYSQSRSGSAEDLTSLDSVASNAIPASLLSARLQNLNSLPRNSSFVRRQHHTGSGGNTPLPIPEENGEATGLATNAPGYFDIPHPIYPRSASHSRGHSAPNSNPMSRRTSTEIQSEAAHSNPALGLQAPTPGVSGTSNPTTGTHTPEHLDYAPNELEDLNKVPSYTTALKTPVRGLSYSENWNLPNYETAISRPSSPVRGNSTGHHTPEVIGSPMRGAATPPNGLRGHGASPSRSNTAPASRPHSVLGMGLSHIFHGLTPMQPAHIHGTTRTGVDDGSRRLEVMRANG